MTDKLISDYTAATALKGDDLFECLRDSASVGVDRKVPGTIFLAGGLGLVAGTDAAVTMLANVCYELSASILTADRIYTLPAGGSVGDVIEIGTYSSNATYEIILKTGTGETCTDPKGGTDIASASEITRLFTTGEWMKFKKISSTKWRAYDGRRAMNGLLRLTTDASAEDPATLTYPTAKSGVWVADKNIGSCAVIATDKLICRRACTADFRATGTPANAIADGAYFGVAIELNGTTLEHGPVNYAAASTQIPGRAEVSNFTMAVDDYMRYQFRSSAGSKGLLALVALSTFSMTEKL